jgi:hypothetical protein
LTPESNYEGNVLDLELDIWHSPLYDHIVENFIKPMFSIIKQFEKRQLFDWIKWSIDLTRPIKGAISRPMPIDRKRNHDELKLALTSSGVKLNRENDLFKQDC